jgi:hypothetical protein
LLTGATSDRIYTLEHRINQQHAGQTDAESSPLLSGQVEEPDKVFSHALDTELEKVVSFYQRKEREIYDELDQLLEDEKHYEHEQNGFEQEQENVPPGRKTRSSSVFQRIGLHRTTSASSASRQSDDDSDDDANETSQLRRKSTGRSRSPDGRRPRGPSVGDSSRRRTSVAFEDYNDMAFSALYDEGVSLKKRIASVYVSLCELRSFIQLNRTGFSKVLKKYDKILDRSLKTMYLEKYVSTAYPFRQSTMDKLGQSISQVEVAYSRICTKGDVVEAKRELRLHLREHVVWERNTVWREMIGIERKAQAANFGVGQMLGRKVDPGHVRLQGDDPEAEMKEVETPIGRYRCPRWLLSSTFYILLVILAVFFVLLLVPIMEKPEQQNCLALVVLVSLMWATEVRIYRSLVSIFSQLVGDSAVRHVPPCAVPGCHSPCRQE